MSTILDTLSIASFGLIKGYNGSTVDGAIYGSAVASPSGTNHSLYIKSDGTDTDLNSTSTVGLCISNVAKLTANSTSVTATVPVLSGIAKMGAWPTNTNYARFGHSTQDNATGYGFIHDVSGQVSISAPTGQGIFLCIQAATEILITDTLITMVPPVQTAKYLSIGTSRADNTYAGFDSVVSLGTAGSMVSNSANREIHLSSNTYTDAGVVDRAIIAGGAAQIALIPGNATVGSKGVDIYWADNTAAGAAQTGLWHTLASFRDNAITANVPATVQNAKMGHSAYYTASDWARFGHSAMDNEKGYGYMQYYDGQVLLSAPAGKTLSLSIDNSSQVLLNGSTVTISVPIASTVVAGTFLYRTQGATTTAGYDYTIYDRDSTALAGAGAKIVEVARTGATHTGMPLSAVYGSENGNVVITSEDNTKALRFGFGWGLFAEKLSISNTAITASVPIKMTNMQLSNTGSYGGIWGSDIATPSTTNYSFLALNDGTTTSVSGSTSVSLNLAGAIQVYMDANQLSTTVPVVQKTTGYNLTTYIQLVNNSTYNLQPGSYNSYYASGSLTAQTFVIGTTFMQQGSVAYLTLEARDTVIQLNLQWPRQDGTGVNYLYISKSTGPSIKSVDLIIVRCGSGFKVIGNTYS